jgi:hypothetical protein
MNNNPITPSSNSLENIYNINDNVTDKKIVRSMVVSTCLVSSVFSPRFYNTYKTFFKTAKGIPDSGRIFYNLGALTAVGVTAIIIQPPMLYLCKKIDLLRNQESAKDFNAINNYNDNVTDEKKNDSDRIITSTVASTLIATETILPRSYNIYDRLLKSRRSLPYTGRIFYKLGALTAVGVTGIIMQPFMLYLYKNIDFLLYQESAKNFNTIKNENTSNQNHNNENFV